MLTPSFAQDDLASFCFKPSVKLIAAKEELEYLLLPREKIFLRTKDHCFDIATSGDRVKLLEKFLAKRYNLVSESSEANVPALTEHCRLKFKTTRAKALDVTEAQLNPSQSVLQEGKREKKETSTADILLGLGKPGSLDLEGKSLFVECRKGIKGTYQLSFFFAEKDRARVSSEVSLRAGELLNVANIVKELNEKNKALGFPESAYKEMTGQETTTYELQIEQEQI